MTQRVIKLEPRFLMETRDQLNLLGKPHYFVSSGHAAHMELDLFVDGEQTTMKISLATDGTWYLCDSHEIPGT